MCKTANEPENFVNLPNTPLPTIRRRQCRRRRLREAALTPGQLHDYGHHAETRKGTSGNVGEGSEVGADEIFEECREVLIDQLDNQDLHPQVAVGHAGDLLVGHSP
eukprot:GHVT01053127.1.p1 GENE.GHVT01053127.1~~GHVT01053127.1.p1  ORF type:complete len:106 (-),score=18.97 GHVT01053127.1:201-518(-)